MELYFSPLACSMATRIALYEAGADASFIRADTKVKRTADGGDFLAINPMGQVPTLRIDDGELLTENLAVLQYVADRFPAAELAPTAGGIERYRLQQWLSFIATELHKAVFIPLLDRTSPGGAKDFAHQKVGPRFAYLAKHLDGREHLLDRFTVADAYLATVLNWCRPSGVELSEWPAVQAYHRRMLARPSIAKAFAEERALYEAG
ncbi:MAG TPA: glutathione binding-like protein [Stellaceae bacterium]